MSAPEGYSIRTIEPPNAPLEVGGLATREDGTIIASTRSGQVWEYSRQTREWSLVTDGLHQALGVVIDDESGDLVTAHKPGLIRLIDGDGDGMADEFEFLTTEWGYQGNYHEWAFGPVQDSDGNFYVTLATAHDGPGPTVGNSIMNYSSPYRGWCVRVTPDGEFDPFASGMRSPAGVGISPDDEVFYMDQQGGFVPTSFIAHVQEGNFHGHAVSLYGDPDFDRDPDSVSMAQLKQMRTPPAVYVPYNMSLSPIGLTYNDTDGAFGPFDDQLFFGGQSLSKMMRADLEMIDGQYQGAVFDFADGLQCGVIREEFSPSGQSLWLGQSDRGFGSEGSAPYGLQRIDYDGDTVPFEMQSIGILSDGFEITFTKPADTGDAGDPGNYEVSHWTYNYWSTYGSSRVNESSVDVSSADVSDGGETVAIELPSVEPPPSDGDLAGRIYGISLDVDSADGESLMNDTGYYTVNEIPE
jgi:hypothetical protein